MKAIIELREQTKALMNGGKYPPKVYPHQIAFNALPHIDVFLENGYTKEEIKMVNETKKIMEDDSIKVSATTVRVPVYRGHSESVNIEFESEMTPERAPMSPASAPRPPGGLRRRTLVSPSETLAPHVGHGPAPRACHR